MHKNARNLRNLEKPPSFHREKIVKFPDKKFVTPLDKIRSALTVYLHCICIKKRSGH